MVARTCSLGYLLLLSLALFGCSASENRDTRRRSVEMEVTAYCSCGRCCGWRRNLLGVPVHTGGSREGQRKILGICADGMRVRRGVAAADTDYYPFGTRIHVPGYGWATVCDRGSAIKGPGRLDIFFPRHSDAVQWGRQNRTVRVHLP